MKKKQCEKSRASVPLNKSRKAEKRNTPVLLIVFLLFC
jgi:hypothetical protein